jgi:hypothetical protein
VTAFVAVLIAAGVSLLPPGPAPRPRPVPLGFQIPRKGGNPGPDLDPRRGGKLEVQRYDKLKSE